MKRLGLLLALLVPSPLLGQDLEAALVAGYTTAGDLSSGALGVEELELGGAFTWAASVGYHLSPRFGIEVSWSRRESALAIGTAGGEADMFDVHVDQVQGSAVFHLRAEASVRPFVTAGLGAAFFSARDLQGETKLSLGLGAGLKWRAAKRLDARVQARYVPTHLADTSSDFCDPFGFCQGWLHQLEMSAGVAVRF